MVCPLRLVLALASVALLLYSGAALLLDSPAGEALARRLTRADRSWWRFAAALFTGELVYAFYGKDAGGAALVGDACGAGGDAGAGTGAGRGAGAVADVSAAVTDLAAEPAPAAAAAASAGEHACAGAGSAALHQRAAVALA